MSYCSISDITGAIAESELIQLTNDAGGSTVDNDKITDAINYADNMIDGYLRGRYSLPLSSTPDELKYLSIDLVVYRLYSRRMYTEIPETVTKKFDDVMKTLKDIQKGNFSINSGTDEYSDPILDTDKTTEVSSVNKYYDEEKWDEYDLWL